MSQMLQTLQNGQNNNTLMYIGIFLVVVLVISVVIFLLFPTLRDLFKDKFSNASGYGINHNFGKMTTLIPLNKVSKSTDFKLLSLMSQIRFKMINPLSLQQITGTSDGIINRTPNKNANIILFPGLSDYILRQNGRKVWPKQYENMKNDKPAIVYENNKGHFNSITTLLENLKYVNGDKLNTITYDFRKMNFKQIFKQFSTYLKPNTIIIGYDFGCVVANMCINYLKKQKEEKNPSKEHNYINKFIMICPTIGGIPITLRDYFSGNGIVDPLLIENYDSVLMSMPNKKFYEKPIAIYNSVSYNCNNIDELMKYQNKSSNTINLFTELVKTQELSFENPEVDCIIVGSQQFNTPIAYNFKNDLSQSPERYLPKNNNQHPNDDIHYNGTFEGLQTKGDRVVPISSILKLKEMWNNNKNTINVELIKDKDHFTILKSYELALIIMANI